MRVAPRILVALAAVFLPAATGAVTLPDRFQETPVYTGLVNPTAVRFAANGQVFVAEKSGIVNVYDGVGDATPTPVVDLRTQVHNYWDRGLLGLAVDPNSRCGRTSTSSTCTTRDRRNGAPALGRAGRVERPVPDAARRHRRRLRRQRPALAHRRQAATDERARAGPGRGLVPAVSEPLRAAASRSVPDGKLYVTAGDGASFNFVDWGQDGSPVNPCGDPPGGSAANLTPPTARGRRAAQPGHPHERRPARRSTAP